MKDKKTVKYVKEQCFSFLDLKTELFRSKGILILVQVIFYKNFEKSERSVLVTTEVDFFDFFLRISNLIYFINCWRLKKGMMKDFNT